jgi:hypothetical protein
MNPSGDIEVSKPQEFHLGNGTMSGIDKIPGSMTPNYIPQGDFEPSGQDFQRGGVTQNSAMMAQYNPYYQYSGAFYDPFIDISGPFNTKFPSAKDYTDLQSIIEAFPHLTGLNDPEFDVEKISPDAQFYILRSSNDDNIHKSIKYQVWTSTPSGKNVLRKAWQEFQEKGVAPEIYLIFSVVSSNQFLGVAKMTSDMDDRESFKYWWEPCKWFGTFKISWLFVKDIHHAKFEQIKEEASMTSVINLKDGTMISANTGKQMLTVFKDHPNKPSIFDYFDYMDRREDYIRAQRDNNSEFEKYFNECCEAYQENPDSVFPQRRPYYGRRGYRKPMTNGNHGAKRFNNNYSNGHSQSNNGTTYQKNYHQKSEPTKAVSLAEQFTIITESDKLNKKNKISKKGKRTDQKDDRVAKEFFEQGKDFPKLGGENQEDEQGSNKSE